MAHIQWKKEVAYLVDKSGNSPRWIKLGKVSAKQAKKAKAKYESDETYLRLGFLDDGKITLNELFDEYIADARKKKGAYTVEIESSQLPVFRAKWGCLMARDIKASDVEALLDGNGYRPATVKNKMIVLSNVWAFAVRQGYFKENEMKKCRRPALEILPPLEVQEASIDAIIEKCRPGAKQILQVLKYTACRPSEVLRLQVRDINLARRAILLRHTKTKRSRTVPMAKKLIGIFEAILVGKSENDFLFPDEDRKTLRYAFDQAKEAAGVTERIFPQALRHFALTKFLDVTGGDLRAAAQLAGHSQIQTTMRYTHRPEAVVKKGVDKL
jgi:integrase